LPYIVNPISTQVLVPGTNEPDINFYDLRTVQVVIEIKYRTYLIGNSPQFQGADIVNLTLRAIESAVYGMLSQAENEGMIEGVDVLKKTIIAQQDSSNPNQVDISYSIKPVNALIVQVYTENVLSATVFNQLTA
jgi:phage tail sheath gpL-like